MTLSEGHGWINPLPFGVIARCGGPFICDVCAIEECDVCHKIGAGCFADGDAKGPHTHAKETAHARL